MVHIFYYTVGQTVNWSYKHMIAYIEFNQHASLFTSRKQRQTWLHKKSAQHVETLQQLNLLH